MVLDIPRFTESADLVLPWLHKNHPLRIDYRGHYAGDYCDSNEWRVTVWKDSNMMEYAFAKDKTLARAAVIALLRAHNVEIEFTS